MVEEKTKNVTIVNSFTQRIAEDLTKPIPFVVFAILTNGRGHIRLEVVVEQLGDLEEVHRAEGTLFFDNPLRKIRSTIRIRDCVFPAAGHYQVTLLATDELIAQRNLHIREQEDSK